MSIANRVEAEVLTAMALSNLQSSITKCSCSWDFIKLLEQRSPSWLSCFKGHEVGMRYGITLFSFKRVFCGTAGIMWNIPHSNRIWRIFHRIWSIPHNTIMDLNNVTGFQIVALKSLCMTTSKVEDLIKLAQWQVMRLVRIFKGDYS